MKVCLNNYIVKIKENDEVKNSIIYLSSTIFTKGITFIIIPILTALLTIEDYGKLSLFESYFNLTCALILFSTPNYLSKHYYKTFDISIKIKYCILINFFVTLILILGLISFSFFRDLDLPIYILLAIPILGLFNSVIETYLIILRLKKKALDYLKLEISRLLVDTLFLFLFVISFKLGWISKFYSIFIALLLLATYCFIRISQLINFRFNLKLNLNELKKTFYFLLPLIIHSISFTLINTYDKISIQNFLGLEDLAIYSVYSKFTSVSIIVIVGINKAFSPKLFELMSNNYSIEFDKQIKQLIMFLIVLLLLIGALVFTFDGYFLPKEYLAGSFLIPFFCLSFLFYGVYSIIFPIIISKGNNLYLMFFTLFSAILNIILNNILIKPIGLYGAVLGTLFAFFFLMLLTGIYSRKLVKTWMKNI